MVDLVVTNTADGGTKLTGLPEGWANSAELQRVWLWDIGPEKPKAPQRPTLPKGLKEDTPEYDLAKVEFKQLLEEYETELKTYQRQKREHADFQKGNGGPVELMFFSCDAADALDRDQRAVKDGRQERPRYYVSSRTRGHKGVPNRGLPDGLKPGHGQAANEQRERDGQVEFEKARLADPVFGQTAAQQELPL